MMPEPVGFVQNLALQSAMAIVNSPALVLQKVLLLWAARWSGVAMILAPYVLFRTHARERQRGIWRHIWTLYHKYAVQQSMESVEIVKAPEYVACADAKVLLCCFPHGCMPVSVYAWLEHEEDIVIHTVNPVLYEPTMRFLFVGCRGGFSSVSRANIKRTIEMGKRAIIWPGGVRESLIFEEADPVYRGHSGFLRLAIAEGYTLVPMWVDGECEIMGNATPRMTQWCYSALGLPLSIPYWKGTKPKVTVRYGAPIRTNGADLASLSADFWAGLAKLRAQGGGPPQPLAQLRSRL